MPEIVGFLAPHPTRPERLALLRPDGTVSNTFGQGEDRTAVAALLRQAGLILQDDNSVTRETGE